MTSEKSKEFTTNKDEFKNNVVVYLPELLIPVKCMNDNKLYQVHQTEDMVNKDDIIIGKVEIQFNVKNGQLIIIDEDADEEPDEILTLDFRKNKTNN